MSAYQKCRGNMSKRLHLAEKDRIPVVFGRSHAPWRFLGTRSGAWLHLSLAPVAGVSHPIAIGIELIRVLHLDAVVARVTVEVAVGVGLR